MEHRQEIEIKLEVHDPEAIKRRLRELKLRRVKPRHFESNRLFDFPDRALARSRCLVRLRRALGRTIMTFKGAPVRSERYKVRTEIETEVKDGAHFEQILQRAGLREIFRYDKRRTEYELGIGDGKSRGQGGRVGRRLGSNKGAQRGKVVYDETPIGDYLELEGPRRWIDQVARLLGFSRRDYITLSYAVLYYQKCREAGRKPGNMVFPARKRPVAASSR